MNITQINTAYIIPTLCVCAQCTSQSNENEIIRNRKNEKENINEKRSCCDLRKKCKLTATQFIIWRFYMLYQSYQKRTGHNK
mmetsp:Transcript_63086/g.100264  ORF Transcript_63086/g.100264 Transcript_63086/m.100264 type:complete len:82 (-) Transcript_63086:358-603(-)